MCKKLETRQKCGTNRSMVQVLLQDNGHTNGNHKGVCSANLHLWAEGEVLRFPRHTHTHTPTFSACSSSHSIWGITLSTPYIISLIKGPRRPTHAIWNLYRHRWETLDSAIRTGRVLILDPNWNTDGSVRCHRSRWKTTDFYRTQSDHISDFFWTQSFNNTWKCVLPTYTQIVGTLLICLILSESQSTLIRSEKILKSHNYSFEQSIYLNHAQ